MATRSICASVVRPKGTRSVDAAVLLAQMMVPASMRPGWREELAMEWSVIPYERLPSVDARCEGTAARPVITPQTIVVDQDNVFISGLSVTEGRPHSGDGRPASDGIISGAGPPRTAARTAPWPRRGARGQLQFALDAQREQTGSGGRPGELAASFLPSSTETGAFIAYNGEDL